MSGSCRFVAVIVLASLSGCGAGVDVELVSPSQAALSETFTEPARTELLRTFPVAMPLAGRLAQPITLRVGDEVTVQQALATVDPASLQANADVAKAAIKEGQAALKTKDDDRMEETAKLHIKKIQEAGRKTLEASDAQVQANRAHLRRAKEELVRVKKELKAGTASQKVLLDAQLRVELSTIELRKQETDRASTAAFVAAIDLGPRWISDWLGKKKLERVEIQARIERARSELRRAEHELGKARIAAPAGGVVLTRHEDGTGPFAAGTPLLTLGRREDARVVAEVLTQDALRIAPGSAVQLTARGGATALAGKVERIEPAGFTKRSSLGVEQQRVRVWIAVEGGLPKGLGIGYRLQATFDVATKQGALTVPRFSVLEAPDGSHYVFKVSAGRVTKQTVTLGLRGSLRLEVAEGLTAQDRIVAAPDATMKEGVAVRAAK